MGLLLAVILGLVRRHGFFDPAQRATTRNQLRGWTPAEAETHTASSRAQWILVAVFVVGNIVLVSSRSAVIGVLGFVLLVGSLVLLIVMRLRARRGRG